MKNQKNENFCAVEMLFTNRILQEKFEFRIVFSKQSKTNSTLIFRYLQGFDEISMCFTQIYEKSQFRDRNSGDFFGFVVVFEQL